AAAHRGSIDPRRGRPSGRLGGPSPGSAGTLTPRRTLAGRRPASHVGGGFGGDGRSPAGGRLGALTATTERPESCHEHDGDGPGSTDDLEAVRHMHERNPLESSARVREARGTG